MAADDPRYVTPRGDELKRQLELIHRFQGRSQSHEPLHDPSREPLRILPRTSRRSTRYAERRRSYRA